MPLAVGQNEAPDPPDIGLLGTPAVVQDPDLAAHLLQQPGGLTLRYAG